MGHDLVWLIFPIMAIGGGMVKRILASQERRLEMRLNAQQGLNEAANQQIAALQKELAALRDTSTQFDMSLDNNVQRLEDRLGRLEAKSAAQPAINTSDAMQQHVGLN